MLKTMLRIANKMLLPAGYQIVPIKNGQRYLLEPHVLDIAEGLIPVVRHWDRQHGLAGDRKRHQAYASGLKMFPDRLRSDVSLAVEYAYRWHKGPKRG